MSDHAQPPRYSLVTWGLFAINVVVYLAQVATGVNWLAPSAESMLGWGANLAAYSLTDQPWRLLTSMFLHVGLVHLALNMYMLLTFGSLVERRFGHVRILLVYLLSGLVGSLVSALWHVDPFNQVIGAGASGALMGLCGAYLADWLVAQWRNDPHEQISTGGPLVQTIVINLVIGAAMPGIDNAAHVGGLIGGFVVGGTFAMVPRGFSRLQRALAVTLISGLALGAIYAKLNGEPSEALALIKQLRAAEQAEHK
jgi:membrane associated rhomboid family serine protease